jgi:hypothetical protein
MIVDDEGVDIGFECTQRRLDDLEKGCDLGGTIGYGRRE